MQKYYNPRLHNAVVAGTGMEHPRRPHVVLGSELNGYVQGDLVDANGICDLIHEKNVDTFAKLEALEASLKNESKARAEDMDNLSEQIDKAIAEKLSSTETVYGESVQRAAEDERLQSQINDLNAAIQEHQDISGKADKTAVYAALATKADKSTTYTKEEVDNLIDGVDVSEQLENYYTEDETDAALAGKQDILTFDNAPTANSNNPVTSEGVMTALGSKADQSTTYTKTEVDNKLADGVYIGNTVGTDIKQLKDKNNVVFYPQTHTKAVIDDYGNSIEDVLDMQTQLINQAQMEAGTVPSDNYPTEGSTNWVTSGGVYNAVQDIHDELDGYVYNGIEELSVGQTYEEGQNVKTSESEILKLTKEVGKLTVNNAIAADTYWVYSGHTYKAVSAVSDYSTSTTYSEGSLALGSPTEIFFTVTAETPTAGNIDITVGSNSATVAVTSESTAAGIAADIITGIGTIDGWNWTNNEDGSFKLTKSTAGSGTLTVTFTDTGSTGVLVANESVAGTTKVAIYSNGQWAAATLASMVSSSVFAEQTVNDLYTICQQAALIDDINERWTISESSINYISGHYYNSTGQVRSSVNCGYTTEHIPVEGNDTLTFNVTTANSTAFCIPYNSNGRRTGSINLSAAPKYYTVSDDTKYIVVSFPLSQVDTFYVKNSAGEILWKPKNPKVSTDGKELDGRLKVLEDEVGVKKDIVITEYTTKYVIQAKSTDENFGKPVYYNNTSYAISPFIPVSGYNKFSVNILTTTTAAVDGAGLVVYNKDKEPIVGYYKSIQSSNWTVRRELPQEAAYIRFSNWTGRFTDGNAVLTLWDTLGEYAVRELEYHDERISALEGSQTPVGLTGYDYSRKRVFLDSLPTMKVSAKNGTANLNLTGTGQGGAVFGDYYFIGVGSHDNLNVYDLKNQVKITNIALTGITNSECHCNTLAFSDQYYAEEDTIPILYISSGHADTQGNTQAYGFRITNTNNTWAAALVHTITLISGWSEFLIDNSKQKAWIKTGGCWYCTNMPQHTAGDVTIDVSSLTPEFRYPSYSGSAQGHFFYNDKIYFPSGIPGTENVSKLYVLNTKTGVYDSIIDLMSISGTDEPENAFVWDGGFYIGYRSRVRRLYFDEGSVRELSQRMDELGYPAISYLGNRFYGKRIAIVGDSISTYENYMPTGYATYYPREDVTNVSQMWWRIVCDKLTMPYTNCAWSGSKVTGAPKGSTAIAGCSDQRITDCGRSGVPDVIIFYIGCNDLAIETPLGTWTVDDAIIDDSSYTSIDTVDDFKPAYALMVKKAMVAYPEAKIFCCTLLDDVKRDENAGYPSNQGSITVYQYNKAIKEIADALGASVIDVHSCGLNYFNMGQHSIDGLHPDAWGQRKIADKVIAGMLSL